jgi:hypothetical protein
VSDDHLRVLRSRRPVRVAVLALALAAVGCNATGSTYAVDDKCPAQNKGAVGDPTGRWYVKSYCQVPYARTAADDWCSKLVYDNAGIRDGLFLGSEITTLQRGSWINYDFPPGPPCGDKGTCGTYEVALIFAGQATTIFPLACLQQHLADPTCADLQVKIKALNNVLSTIQDVHCVDAPTGNACSCTYTVTNATSTTDLGAWRVDDGLLIHYPGILTQAGAVDFGIDGDTMYLHGHDGLPLFARDPLRNLDLARCDDAAILAGSCPCDADAAKRGICVKQ